MPGRCSEPLELGLRRHDDAIGKLDGESLQICARTRAEDAQPILDTEARTVRAAHDQLAVARKEFIRLHIELMAGMRAAIQEPINRVTASHDEQ